MNKSDKGASSFNIFGRKNLKHWLKNGALTKESMAFQPGS